MGAGTAKALNIHGIQEDAHEKPQRSKEENLITEKGKKPQKIIQCSDFQESDREIKQPLASNEDENNTYKEITRRTQSALDKAVLPPVIKLSKTRVWGEFNFKDSAQEKKKTSKITHRHRLTTIYDREANLTSEQLDDFLLSSDVIEDEEDKNEGLNDFTDPFINAQCPVEDVLKKDDFSKIDQLTLMSQYNETESVESLALKLVKPAKTQLEKIRAIYLWIVNCSRFDSQDTHIDNKDTAVGIMKRKGAAYLFDSMCKLVDVEVQIIKGFNKDNAPGTTFTKTTPVNHSWNAVKIRDKWYLIDCSCAIEEDFLVDFYFLAQPSLLIYSHFPVFDFNDAKNTELQLLDSPITLNDFNKAVEVEPRASLWGVQPLSHKEKTIHVTGLIDISIGNESGSLSQVESVLLNSSDSSPEKGCVFTRKSDNSKKIIITVKTRSLGNFNLNIFGHVDPAASTLWLLMKYVINSDNCIDLVPFPDDSSLWGMKPGAISYGLCPEYLSTNKVLYETDKKSKELLIPVTTLRPVLAAVELQSAQNSNRIDSQYCLVEVSANFINIKVRFPRRDYYKLTLILKHFHEDKENYEFVGTFLIDAREVIVQPVPFPRTNSKFMEYYCSRVQPNYGILPEHTAIECKFYSTVIEEACIGHEMMQKNGNEFYAIVRTPGASEMFTINGSTKNETVQWILMECQVTKTNEDACDIIKKQMESDPCFFDEWCGLVQCRSELARQNEISAQSHMGKIIVVDEETKISISDANCRVLSCKATLISVNVTKEDKSEYIYLRKRNNEILLTVSPPPSGIYLLKLLGKVDLAEPRHNTLIIYKIKSTKEVDNKPFPRHPGEWGFTNAAVKCGFQTQSSFSEIARVVGETKMNFQINRPVTPEVSLTFENQTYDYQHCVLVENEGSSLSLSIKLPTVGYYKLTLFCLKNLRKCRIGTFLLQCIQPKKTCLPFPSTTYATQDCNCVLIEPMDKMLKAHTTITFKFKSPYLAKASVFGRAMSKNLDEWTLTITTPDIGNVVEIDGIGHDGRSYSSLYKFQIS